MATILNTLKLILDLGLVMIDIFNTAMEIADRILAELRAQRDNPQTA